jgi:hypothetical protein
MTSSNHQQQTNSKEVENNNKSFINSFCSGVINNLVIILLLGLAILVVCLIFVVYPKFGKNVTLGPNTNLKKKELEEQIRRDILMRFEEYKVKVNQTLEEAKVFYFFFGSHFLKNRMRY